MKKSSAKKIKANDFDKIFEQDMDKAIEFLDIDHPVKKVNVDFNTKTIRYLDMISNDIGITRQSLIKMWIHEKIQEELDRKMARSHKVS